jgi:hypothetical protein
MPRADLLALSADDLATLTNRGTLKRAWREVEGGEVTCTFDETPAGDLTARWSDGVECRVPAGAVLADGRCSCAAAGLCRHLVRTALAYQKQAAPAPGGPPAAPAAPWDPGTIPDEELACHWRPAALAKLREQFRQGVLVELVRGSKPSARFHLPGCLVRFLVPGDPRYTHCDCAAPAPCPHVPLAVWSFRLLAPGKAAGILATGARTPPLPAGLLDDLEAALGDLAGHGLSGAPAACAGRLARLENACREADLVWPAEVLAELLSEQERYAAHDARFAPERVAELVGEWAARLDAIRGDTGALPQVILRGSRADRPTTLGSARFVGLGCDARAGRRGVTLTAYLQDSDSGTVVAVSREFAEGDADPQQPPRSFGELAQASAVKGSSFAALGAGQLLIRGGKRTAGCRLLPGRAEASVGPQTFAWEGLRPPVLVEEFAELEARLGALPPAALRPRRVAEDFHVCTVAGAEGAAFVAATQTARAVLVDPRGGRALLEHPFAARAQAGTEALLALLREKPHDLRFVSGHVRRGPSGLVIQPVCLVAQEGSRRVALQPWVEKRPAAGPTETEAGAPAGAGDPLAEYLGELQGALGELFVLGLDRADALVARRWGELQHRGEAVGLARLARQVAGLAGDLARKGHSVRWDSGPAARRLVALAVLARLAQDLL